MALRMLSTRLSAKKARSAPATQGSPDGFALRGSKRACGRRSCKDWSGAIDRLEHVAAEVGVLRDARQLLFDERRVDHESLAAPILGVEADVLEQFLHHRLQPARADILYRLVDL